MTDKLPVTLNPLLSADWHLPDHFDPCPEYGSTLLGGFIKFGFTCNVCKSTFRQDYRSIAEFDKALVALLLWAGGHRHG